MADLVGGLDPDAVPLVQAVSSWREFDRIERLAASAKTLLARRVEEAGAWKRSGYRSAAEHLAKLSGTSIGAARGQLDTSRRLEQLPRTAEAVRAGQLSSAQADAVSAAVAPQAERRLLEHAQTRLRSKTSGAYPNTRRIDSLW